MNPIRLVVAATHERGMRWVRAHPTEFLDGYGRYRHPFVVFSPMQVQIRGLQLWSDEIVLLDDLDPHVLPLVMECMRPGQYLDDRYIQDQQPVTISKNAEKKLRANLLTLRRKLAKMGGS